MDEGERRRWHLQFGEFIFTRIGVDSVLCPCIVIIIVVLYETIRVYSFICKEDETEVGDFSI